VECGVKSKEEGSGVSIASSRGCRRGGVDRSRGVEVREIAWGGGWCQGLGSRGHGGPGGTRERVGGSSNRKALPQGEPSGASGGESFRLFKLSTVGSGWWVRRGEETRSGGELLRRLSGRALVSGKCIMWCSWVRGVGMSLMGLSETVIFY